MSYGISEVCALTCSVILVSVVYLIIHMFVTAGGLMGYMKRGSKISLVAGGGSAALFYYVYTELPANPVLASSIGIGK